MTKVVVAGVGPAVGLAAGLAVLSLAHAAHAADGIFDQVRVGVLSHDVRFLDGRENGVDLNGEVQFVSPVPDSWGESLPDWLKFVLKPRPDVGASINTLGYTSQGYVGLTWTIFRFNQVFTSSDAITFDYSFGPSFNDGYVDTTRPDRKSLGSNVLFRLSGEVGYAITPRTAVYLLYDHESNAGLARHNEALNDLGIRVGLKF